jgi:hypothetical protein
MFFSYIVTFFSLQGIEYNTKTARTTNCNQTLSLDPCIIGQYSQDLGMVFKRALTNELTFHIWKT